MFPHFRFRPWLFARLIPCALLLAWTVPARADYSPFIVNSWSVEEELPDSEAISVIQGREGCLWIGTLDGLVRFDGNRFTVFNEMNTPRLSSDHIVFLYEDRQTNLWIGTESSGLEMIQNGAIQKFFTSSANVGPVNYAAQDPSGATIFTAANGMLMYRDQQMYVRQGVVSPNFLPPAQRIEALSESGSYPWGNTPVRAAIQDTNGDWIVGTLGQGIFWADKNGRWENISNDLSSPFILSLCLDREGNLWAGTDGGGLDRIKRKTFNTPEGFPSQNIQSLSPDNQGGWWMASGAQGAFYWSSNRLQNYPVGPLHNCLDVLVDSSQRVWAGTHDEGLFQWQTNAFVPVPGAQIAGPKISSLFEDHGNQLWVGSGNGLARFDGHAWKLFTVQDGLTGNTVSAIAGDARGGLWIGTANDGLNYYRDGAFAHYWAGANSVSGNDISCLEMGGDGVLWVGTSAHGLARFKDGEWSSYSTRDGLASDSIRYILDDGDYLWIGSNVGLMRVAKKSFDGVPGGKLLDCRTYGKGDGLPTRECSTGSQPAACRGADGRLWFPTVEGVAFVDPSQLQPNRLPPTVMIESIRINGQEQNTNPLAPAWPPAVTIAAGGDRSEIQLEIHYTAMDFSAPNLVRFKYQLKGYQNGVTDAGNDRVARYPKLPPGNYTFSVTAYNEDGVRNENDGSFKVIVLPQFWQTGWFQAALVIIILGLVAGLARYVSVQKLRRELQRHKQQEALERERSRIARDLHDQLGANLTQVALLGEMAEADKHAPEEVESHARQISETARETTRALDEIVWAINPANDTLEGVTNYCIKYAQEFFELAGVRCRVDAPAQLPNVSLPPEVRHNVFLAFKESVNNVVKHAQAGEARIHLVLNPDSFVFEITDNGKGLPADGGKPDRSGLRNLRKRMADIGGSFEIGPAPEKGTLVRLTAPISGAF